MLNGMNEDEREVVLIKASHLRCESLPEWFVGQEAHLPSDSTRSNQLGLGTALNPRHAPHRPRLCLQSICIIWDVCSFCLSGFSWLLGSAATTRLKPSLPVFPALYGWGAAGGWFKMRRGCGIWIKPYAEMLYSGYQLALLQRPDITLLIHCYYNVITWIFS